MSGAIFDVQSFADGTAMALGYSYPGTVVLRYDGAAWRDITPAGWGPGGLLNLSMISPTEGWAAGTFDVPQTNTRRPAIMHLRDGQWTEEQMPSFAAISATAIGMRNAGEAGQSGVGDLHFQVGHARCAARALQGAVHMQRHAAGIVAAVLKPFQALQQNGSDVALRDRADDATHRISFKGGKQ